MANASLNKSKKKPNDCFYTPTKLAKHCIKLVDLKKDDTVLDPFYGEGVFYKNYPDFVNKKWCEIEKGKDFFDFHNQVDWIISNPPFSKLNDVLNHCCKICTKGFGLILMTLATTHSRVRRIHEKGFKITKVYLFRVRDWNLGFPCWYVLFEKKDGIGLFGLPEYY